MRFAGAINIGPASGHDVRENPETSGKTGFIPDREFASFPIMIKKLIKRVALDHGYLITKVTKNYDREKGFTLFTYQREDGTFDYEKYKAIQTKGNKDKLHNVWVQEENIKFLANYVKQKIPNPTFGLCHGTRRGNEQKWFSEALGCHVLGTEISDTATQFPNTIQWDFHEVKPEWIGNVDFIYSNSFDHSFDPEKCINAWMSCLKPNGVCILEHSEGHGFGGVTELDPFGAELVHMPYLVALWGKGKFGVREILDAPKRMDSMNYLKFLVLQKFQ